MKFVLLYAIAVRAKITPWSLTMITARFLEGTIIKLIIDILTLNE